MTVTLELKPEVEERITAEAKARGLSVEDYVQRILEGATTSDPNSLPVEEWLAKWKEWLHSHDYIKAPSLSDQAISRESIYREREDNQL